MHRAMLAYGLSNYEIRSVGTAMKQHVLEIIKDKSTQCPLLTLGCINRAHVTEVPAKPEVAKQHYEIQPIHQISNEKW